MNNETTMRTPKRDQKEVNKARKDQKGPKRDHKETKKESK